MSLWSFEGVCACTAKRGTFTISAVIAVGKHLFPFRTEKLSPLAPMVLGGQPPGRVGRRPLLHARGSLRSPVAVSGTGRFPRPLPADHASPGEARLRCPCHTHW